jgi:hypothetical protein
MPTAILLGVPRGHIDEIRSAIKRRPVQHQDWNLKFIPSRNKWPSFFDSEIKQAMEFARHDGGAHILGFSTERDRQVLARKIRAYFRFRWSDERQLSKIGSNTNEFLESLYTELTEEAEWIRLIKPRGVRSPVLLPEGAFDCDRATGDMWRHVESFGPGNVNSAHAAVQQFEKTHWKKVTPEAHIPSRYLWVDNKSRCFDHSQDRHGEAEFPQNWKYSYELIEGFHYDVRHLEGRSFHLRDIDGVVHNIQRNSYINVDPHGVVRAGTAR